MNDTSSRSHAVFTLILKQIHHDIDTDEVTERVGRMRLDGSFSRSIRLTSLIDLLISLALSVRMQQVPLASGFARDPT